MACDDPTPLVRSHSYSSICGPYRRLVQPITVGANLETAEEIIGRDLAKGVEGMEKS
jgi:hypothetical protein